jgi:hypothetical protein
MFGCIECWLSVDLASCFDKPRRFLHELTICIDGTSIGSVVIAAPMQMADRGMRERNGLASLSRLGGPLQPKNRTAFSGDQLNGLAQLAASRLLR